MKTKYVPPVVMLCAGLIRAVFGILYKQDIKDFLWAVLLVMVIFYILGSIVKVVLDKMIIVTNEEFDELKELTPGDENLDSDNLDQENFEENAFSEDDSFGVTEKTDEDEL